MNTPVLSLPPDLASLARPGAGLLKSVSVRLDPATMEELEALREQLHWPSRGALLRFLVVAGMDSTWERLERFKSKKEAAPAAVGGAQTLPPGK